MDKIKAIHTMEHLLLHAEKQLQAENFHSAARCFNQWEAIGQKYLGKVNYSHLENTNRLYYKNIASSFDTANKGYVVDAAGFAHHQIGEYDKAKEWASTIADAYENRTDAYVTVSEALSRAGLHSRAIDFYEKKLEHITQLKTG